MFNFAYQLELLLTAAKPPLYLSEMTIDRNGPRYIRLEGKPGGWLFRFLLSLIGMAPAPRKVEVYNDRIEYCVFAKWFQSKDKIMFSTICSTGHQFIRFPHFLFAAWCCIIYGILTMIPLFKTKDEVPTVLIVTCIGFVVAGLIFLWLYFKVQRYIIYAYTNCGKGMLFAFKPRKSFILAPRDSINTTLEDVDSLMNFLAELIDANKAARITPSVPQPAVQIVSPKAGAGPLFAPSRGAQTSVRNNERFQSRGAQLSVRDSDRFQSRGAQSPADDNDRFQSRGAQSPADDSDQSQTSEIKFTPFAPEAQDAPDDPPLSFDELINLRSNVSQYAPDNPPPLSDVDEEKCEKCLNQCLQEFGFENIEDLVYSKTPLSRSVSFQKAIKFAPPERKNQLQEIQKIQERKNKKNSLYCYLALIGFLILLGFLVRYITK